MAKALKKKCAMCTTKIAARATYCSPKCRVAANRAKGTVDLSKKFEAAEAEKYAEAAKTRAVKQSAPQSGELATDDKGNVVDAGTGEILDGPAYGESSGLTEEEILARNPFEQQDEAYDTEAALAAFQKMGLDPVEFITSGIPEFDALTQIPRGRVTQIQGPYGVGKTTLCLNMVAGLRGLRVLYIDTEAVLNAELLTRLQINPETFRLWNESAFIEDVYDTILRALDPKKPAQFDIIILDSLAACTFATEAAGEASSANIGQKAKIVGKLMRIVPMELKRTKTALVIINQEREIIGAYGAQKYTPGGMGVPYAASLMVSLRTNKSARFPKSGPPFKGHEVTAEIIKSKVNEPWRKATFPIYYQAGGHS